MNIYVKSVRNGVIQSSFWFETVIIVIPLAFNFDTKRSYDAWIVFIVILPDVSINIATLDPSGILSISHIAYQSEAFAEFPSSLLTLTGPNVFPFAFAPTLNDVSLTIISLEVSIIGPVEDPDLTFNLNFSTPSVVKSCTSCLVRDACPDEFISK